MPKPITWQVGTIHRDSPLWDVAREIVASTVKHGDQSHLPDGTGDQRWRDAANFARGQTEDASRAGRLTWLDIMREEYFEALAEGDPAKLRAELVQVAAVAVKWIAALDRRTADPTEPDTQPAHKDWLHDRLAARPVAPCEQCGHPIEPGQAHRAIPGAHGQYEHVECTRRRLARPVGPDRAETRASEPAPAHCCCGDPVEPHPYGTGRACF